MASCFTAILMRECSNWANFPTRLEARLEHAWVDGKILNGGEEAVNGLFTKQS